MEILRISKTSFFILEKYAKKYVEVIENFKRKFRYFNQHNSAFFIFKIFLYVM